MIQRYFRRTLAGLALLLLIAGLVLFFTSHLDDFDFDNAVAKELTFTSQGNRLSGTLLLPGNGHPAAVAVIIHGDGPQDRYSDNGYNPLIKQLLAAEQAENDRIFGRNGSKDPAQRSDMTPDRFEFVVKNYLSDATPAIPQMNGRVLAVWGAEDLNVDARQNSCRYQSLLKDNPKTKVIVFPQAGHGLLQAPAYNYQLSSDWPVLRQWQFLYAGREAYHPGALSLITDWIKNKTPDLTAYYPACQS
ncbi:hypothetical protein LLY23_09955 [Morganella morganii]|uniref:alpha/beta fold hydrolase n=1 Tax=Morganella morganii TaxID=582 RepID=UPI0007DB8AA1|nr:hypothetical protein [Morganella morganii]HDS7361484.1 hypothetical protein [Morganella morganii subsp. morganii]EME8469370.1 hypothetical protein [Morganella morganii]OAS01102.1 hypothetical protein AYO06_06905 [Morganella morganii]UEH02173.1 hypothetical protein LLY23_09955 [Morganella morganii]WNJ25139.1 hypothetical protein RJD34_09495 [Morganella morganii]